MHQEEKGAPRPWKHTRSIFPRSRFVPAVQGRSQGLTLLLPLLLLLAAMGGGIYFYETTRLPNDQTLAIEQPPADVRPQIDPVALPATTVTETLVEISGTTASNRDVSGPWMLLTLPERSRYAGLTGARHATSFTGTVETHHDRAVKGREHRLIGSSARTNISVAAHHCGRLR